MKKPLTRMERIAQIIQMLYEGEQHGYARFSVDINDGQITAWRLEKNVKLGNCNCDEYEPSVAVVIPIY